MRRVAVVEEAVEDVVEDKPHKLWALVRHAGRPAVRQRTRVVTVALRSSDRRRHVVTVALRRSDDPLAWRSIARWTTNVSGGWFVGDRLIRPTVCESETMMVMSMVEPPNRWWRRRAGIDGRADEEA